MDTQKLKTFLINDLRYNEESFIVKNYSPVEKIMDCWGKFQPDAKTIGDFFSKPIAADDHFRRYGQAYSVLHELWTFEWLQQSTLPTDAITWNREQERPDFLIELNGQKIWIECVMPSQGIPTSTETGNVFDTVTIDEAHFTNSLRYSINSKIEAFNNYKINNIVSQNDICLIFINGFSIANRPPSGHLLGALGNACYGLNHTTLSIESNPTGMRVIDKFHPSIDLSENPQGETPHPCFENLNANQVTGIIYFFTLPFSPSLNCFTNQPPMPQLLLNLNCNNASQEKYNQYLNHLNLEEVFLPSKVNNGDYRVDKLKDLNDEGRQKYNER